MSHGKPEHTPTQSTKARQRQRMSKTARTIRRWLKVLVSSRLDSTQMETRLVRTPSTTRLIQQQEPVRISLLEIIGNYYYYLCIFYCLYFVETANGRKFTEFIESQSTCKTPSSQNCNTKLRQKKIFPNSIIYLTLAEWRSCFSGSVRNTQCSSSPVIVMFILVRKYDQIDAYTVTYKPLSAF